MDSRIYVLDATPLMMGYAPALSEEPHYTTQEVFDELGEEERLRLSVAKNWIRIREPTRASLKSAKEASVRTRDSFVLSHEDLSILALALDLKKEAIEVTLLTDDYAIQNVAVELSIPFKDYAWKGIRRAIRWKIYCPSCRKTYNTQVKTCPDCGSTLKRKVQHMRMREVDVKS